MKTGELVVKSHRPWQRWLVLAGSWVGVVLVALFSYWLGQVQAGYHLIDVAREREMLQQALAEQKDKSRQQGAQVAVLERTQLIDSRSYDVVRSELKQMQEEILELREEVEFYRGIVSPRERQAGLDIQTFKLESADEERLYHFELVMSQVLKNDRFVKGVVKLVVHGVQDGEPLSLDFRDISPNKSVGRKLSFRYFQRMSGEIRLPEGFVPRNIMIEMAPQKRKAVSKTFDWQELSTG
ncbi:MAG TPA: hypothetical protein ENJ65_03915 [Candidatus Tenderia electrophaga]|uniref:Uncharacterized protein n=1 Tax=Candidatus Tenderia electrophaga TaxID=1748243 RepID=A0A832J712_9GAMM|nr:hypothetical protein [Candidatus Tenderia electrophaga]